VLCNSHTGHVKGREGGEIVSVQFKNKT